MKEGAKAGRAKCSHCGQILGFDITHPWRKTKRVQCPICKKCTWVMLDKTENCLFRLVEYEQSGLSPVQIAAMQALYEECRKYPELSEKLDAWEKKLNGIGGNGGGRGKR